MNSVKKIINQFTIVSTAAYLTTLFYIEIIFFMYGISFISGKIAAIVCGGLISLLLTAFIILLYLEKNYARTAILIFTDLHLASILIYAINTVFYNEFKGIVPDVILYARTLFIPIDIAIIYILTDSTIVSHFKYDTSKNLIR